MAGTIFAVFIFVTLKTFVPTRIIISEPVADIYVTADAGIKDARKNDRTAMLP